MLTPAVLGFATVGAFLALTLLTRTSVIIALVLIPVVAALIGGFGDGLGGFALDGLKLVSPVAAMIMFAILYFGLMLDAGLFEPMIRKVLSVVGGDPVRLCVATAILPMLVALDGDGATTFLISVSALLPVHRRLGLSPFILPTIVGLSAGVMNLLPWGGPTARAMAALNGNIGNIFTPVVPAMLAGILWVLLVSWYLGRRERNTRAPLAPSEQSETVRTQPSIEVGRRFWFNLLLTTALVTLLFRDLYSSLLSIPAVPPALLFMIAFAIALPFNRRTSAAQQEQLAAHATSVVSVVSMILAAGIFTGILNGTGMTRAMAATLAAALPQSWAGALPELVAVTAMPMSLIFPADAYYFGVLPVFANAASTMGQDPLAIGRAAILGQMTTGFPLSPLTASTFILVGLSGVSLREHQRHMFKWAFGTTLVMTVVASITGSF